jgi:hypothetical protein
LFLAFFITEGVTGHLAGPGFFLKKITHIKKTKTRTTRVVLPAEKNSRGT